MKVFLDDMPLAVQVPTVAAAIDAGRSAAGSQGRVIVEAKLDGRSLSQFELDAPSQQEATTGELRFVSADPVALVAYSFRDVASMIPDMRAAQSAAARLLQSGEFEPALTQLAEALGVWESIRRVIDEGPRLIKLDLCGVCIGDVDAAAAVDQLAKNLAAMQAALTAQDWSTLADVLEGDLDPGAERWERLLRGLADRVSQGR
jgi:hypothetical protein